MADYVDALVEQTAVNNAWNAAQADLNRDWQEYMSGTSHQREVQDLIAAGLNPVLSANSGSTWQSVGNASADPSSAQAFGNLAATYLNNQASIEMAKIGASAQIAAASSAASIAAQATRDAAATAAEANIHNNDVNAGIKLMTDSYGFGTMIADKFAGGSAADQWQDMYNKYVHG